MKPIETKSKFIALRAQGMSFRHIAKELHISMSTCFEWQSKLQGHIDLAQQAELESIQEQYQLVKTSRLKRLGMILDKLEQEIQQRDLSDVATDKLITMYLNGLTALKTDSDNVKLSRTYNDIWLSLDNPPELLNTEDTNKD